MSTWSAAPILIVMAGSRAMGIPVEHVVETMRPRPVEPVAGMPPFLLGLSVIRGRATPVVDLGRVSGAAARGEVTRLVALRVERRTVAVAVESVLGVRTVDRSVVDAMPPLLGDAGEDVVASIGVLDSRLLLVLRASRVLRDDIWRALERRETPS